MLKAHFNNLPSEEKHAFAKSLLSCKDGLMVFMPPYGYSIVSDIETFHEDDGTINAIFWFTEVLAGQEKIDMGVLEIKWNCKKYEYKLTTNYTN